MQSVYDCIRHRPPQFSTSSPMWWPDHSSSPDSRTTSGHRKSTENKGEFKSRISALANPEDKDIEVQDLDEDTINKINQAQPYQTISVTKNLPEENKESDLEMQMLLATRMETRTNTTGSVVTAMRQATCKPNAEKERLPEHP